MRTVVGLRRPLFKSADSQQMLRSDAWRDILTAGGIAAALGAGFRGLVGLNKQILDYARKPKDGKRYLGPLVMSVPVPVYSSEQDKEKAQALMLDKAGSYKKASDPSSRLDLPWYLPAVTLAGVTGLAGGYNLTDYLINKKRKLDLKSEIEDARDEYYRTVLQQYNPTFVPTAEAVPDYPLPKKTVNKPTIGQSIKLASLDADLEDLCAEVDKVLEKRALSNWAGKALGIYGALATLLALGSGAAAYSMTRSRSTDSMIEKALREREIERWMRRPPEIQAIPTPVRIVQPVEPPSGDDEKKKKMLPGE